MKLFKQENNYIKNELLKKLNLIYFRFSQPLKYPHLSSCMGSLL